MDKITILYIIDSFINMSGAERNLFEITTNLNPAKYRPIVCSLQGGGLLNDLSKKSILTIDLQVRKILSFNAILKSLILIKLIKKNKVKIVVTYHESSDFLGGVVAKLSSVPVIISSRRDMGYKLRTKHHFIYSIINRLIFDKIITVSNAVKNMLIEIQKCPEEKIVTIYNGVKIDRFAKDFEVNSIKVQLGLNTDNPVVGILAALRSIKGLEYFLESASIVIKNEPRAQFLIAGWQDDADYFLKLQGLAKNLDISKNVFFLDGREDIEEILSAMDISVNTSLNEGFSNTVLESMAAGKPVVATKSGGNPEAVIDKETGLLIPPKDSESLAQAILFLLENRQVAENMGLAGRKRILEIFTFEDMINKIEGLYDLMLKERNARTPIIRVNSITIFAKRLLKVILSRILYYSGTTYFTKLLGKKSIKILAYHKISDGAPNYLGLATKIATFEEQLRYLKKHYNIISLSQALTYLHSGEKNIKNTLVITFDDGYMDNYDNAFPILKKYKIPATIFLTVEPIISKKNLWYESIIRAISDTSEDLIDLSKFGFGIYLINTPKQKENAIEEIVGQVKSLDEESRNKLIEFLSDKLNVNPDNSDERSRMLTWEQIREMKKSGISFGVHTMSHPILTRISEDRAKYEITEARKIIEDKLKEEVPFFAFPNGLAGDFNQEIIKILKDNNFSCACTLIPGENNTDLFSLRRKCVNPGLSEGLWGRFSRPIFAAEISGLFDFLRSQTK